MTPLPTILTTPPADRPVGARMTWRGREWVWHGGAWLHVDGDGRQRAVVICFGTPDDPLWRWDCSAGQMGASHGRSDREPAALDAVSDALDAAQALTASVAGVGLADLHAEIAHLRARLAEVEAERDARPTVAEAVTIALDSHGRGVALGWASRDGRPYPAEITADGVLAALRARWPDAVAAPTCPACDGDDFDGDGGDL